MAYLQSITCPCCQLTSYNPNDAKHLFCGRCHWWTSDPELAPYHFALPCEHRGQGIQLPPLELWHHFARVIGLPDDRPALPVEYPMPFGIDPGTRWLHTQPGTMLEIAGHIRGRRRRWWQRLLWAIKRISRINRRKVI